MEINLTARGESILELCKSLKKFYVSGGNDNILENITDIKLSKEFKKYILEEF